MPGFGPKFFNCILCNCRTKPKNRKHVNKDTAKYLLKYFMVEAKEGEIICSKCTLMFHQKKTKPCNFQQKNSQESLCASQIQDFINLPIKTTVKTHAYCCLCKRPGPKLLSVSSEARLHFFVKRNILLPHGARCCPNHIDEGRIDGGDLDIQTYGFISMNANGIMDLVTKLKDILASVPSSKLDFENDGEMSEEDYQNLTGLNRMDFDVVCQYASQTMRNTPTRSIRTSVGIFLLKMKSGLPNKIMATLLNISKSSLRRAISSVRKGLMTSFVPKHLGFNHISRQAVISDHTRPLAQFLFGDQGDPRAILVIDGTYIYIQKSDNFHFQRRTYSIHKGRPLVKPMVICTTSGYFLSILGPYFADSKNNDAAILNHAIAKNVDTIRQWVKEEDVMVVDRGFRDSLQVLEDLGIKAQMPSFLKKGDKQLSTEDANSSRLVSKVSSSSSIHRGLRQNSLCIVEQVFAAFVKILTTR